MQGTTEGIKEKVGETLQKLGPKLSREFSSEIIEAAAFYLEELMRWNRAYNLVGRKLTPEDLLVLFADSLTPLVFKELFGQEKDYLDIGSGAGMPGIPLYILAGPFNITLVESQRKKVTFLRHIIKKLSLSGVKVYAGRLESMAKKEDFINNYDVGLSRAAMEPGRLWRLARPLLAEGGRLVLFVGKSDADKIKKEVATVEKSGWQLEALRSTQRLVGRDNYLAVLRKSASLANA